MSAAEALPATRALAATAAAAQPRARRQPDGDWFGGVARLAGASPPEFDRAPSHMERRLSLDSLISLTPSLDVVTLKRSSPDPRVQHDSNSHFASPPPFGADPRRGGLLGALRSDDLPVETELVAPVLAVEGPEDVLVIGLDNAVRLRLFLRELAAHDLLI